MAEPRCVLVATDLSAGSDQAVLQAAEAARATGARLAACHVVEPPSQATHLPDHRYEAVTASLRPSREWAEAETRSQISTLTGLPASDFETYVRVGEVAESIVDVAEDLMADLIAVGGRCHGATEGWLLGNVADRVVRYAHCRVLVARPRGPGSLVVAATDFSDPAMPAVECAIVEAGRSGDRLLLLHCIELAGLSATALPLPYVGPPTVLPPLDLEEIRAEADQRLSDCMARHRVSGEWATLQGDASETIVAEAVRRGARLLVIGTRGRTGLRRLVLGSTAETIVRTAPMPVLVVRLDCEDLV